VPAPPDAAMTKIERQKLAQGLVADRQNAQYTDQQLRAGQNMAAIPPPAPEQPAKPAPAAAKTAAPKAAPPPAAAAAKPAAPAPAPPPAAAAKPKPAPAETAEAKPPKKAKTPPPDDGAPAQAASAKPSPRAKRGAEAPPQESSLRPPETRDMPVGEALRQPPPSPVARGKSEKREQLAAATPPEGDAETMAPARGPRPGISMEVAEIGFSKGPFRGKILDRDRKQLADAAKLALDNHATVRVIGYGGAPAGGDLSQREFQSFGAALDNAKAVAVALTELGVPANRIDIETVAKVNSADRADIFVEY
jgi:hypothetical protein